MSVGVMTVGVMSVGVMTVGVMSVGEITVGVMTVGVMRRPQSGDFLDSSAAEAKTTQAWICYSGVEVICLWIVNS